jgi:hypothetical protein
MRRPPAARNPVGVEHRAAAGEEADQYADGSGRNGCERGKDLT